MKMKKILGAFMFLIFIMCLIGCKRNEKTELHFYTRPHTNYQIAGIIYEIYGDPTKIINGFYFENNDSLIDDGILDSLDIVSLVTEIYAEFDVTIPAEEIIPENFNSAEELFALITKLDEE